VNEIKIGRIVRVAIVRGPGLSYFDPVSNSANGCFKLRATNSKVGELLKRVYLVSRYSGRQLIYLQHVQDSHLGHTGTECAWWRSVQTRGNKQTAIRRPVDSNLQVVSAAELERCIQVPFRARPISLG